jgi:MFS family permease
MSTADLLRSTGFWVPFLAANSVMFIVGSILTNTVSIAADSGIAAGVGGYLVAANAMGGALGSIIVGWLADRVDYRIIFAALAAAVAIALLLLMGHIALVPMAVAFGVVGFAGAAVFPLLGVIIVRGFGARAFARVLGALMPMIVIVNAFGPFVTAWVRDVTGSYGIAFASCAALMVVSGLVVVTLRIIPGNAAPVAQLPSTR